MAKEDIKEEQTHKVTKWWLYLIVAAMVGLLSLVFVIIKAATLK